MTTEVFKICSKINHFQGKFFVEKKHENFHTTKNMYKILKYAYNLLSDIDDEKCKQLN